LRRVLEKGYAASLAKTPESQISTPENPYYRIKRDFDDIDRNDYRDKAFEEIRTYFEIEIERLNNESHLRGRFTMMGLQSFTCTVINNALSQGAAHITVHVGNDRYSFGDIFYSDEKNAPPSVSNGHFTVKSNGYELLLEPHLFHLYGDISEMLPPRGVAKLLWKEFVRNVGVAYA